LTTTAADLRPRLGAKDREIDEAMALGALPRRSFGAHKWGVGGLVIVGGAPGFAGAPTLCAMAAGRSGAGIVHVAIPHGLSAVVASAVPETVAILLPHGESAATGRRAVELIEAKLEKSAAMVVGPGLGQDETADALLSAVFGFGGARGTIGFGSSAGGAEASGDGGLVGRLDKPLVIDADGLNWLVKHEGWWDRLPEGRAILTPHVGEMARLLDRPVEEVTADPLATVRDAARRWRQTVVLKYGYTAASDGERTVVADDAPFSLATAGSGDVFAGMIGAFLAQQVAPLEAATLSIYVGMRAARRVEQRVGTLGLVASDLPLAIAEELALLESKQEVERG
jgi:NAD(P)H-hydrate repair Nnr-like enzyme with NAD(P)H-hydrate dehydratase domain